jgi:hypothetical protein
VVAGDDVVTFSYSELDVTGGRDKGGLISVHPGLRGTRDWIAANLVYPKGHELSGVCEKNPDGDDRCRMYMPHDSKVTSTPGAYAVADTLNNRIVWINTPPTGLSTQVLGVLDDTHEDWSILSWPNAVTPIEENGEEFALVTFRGSDVAQGGHLLLGRLELWNVTDLSNMEKVWSYPDDGTFLASAHDAHITEGPNGESLLVYSHSLGNINDLAEAEVLSEGSVGFALFSTTETPTYLGDGRLPKSTEAMGFVRGFHYDAATGTGLLTDSGCINPNLTACTKESRVLEVAIDLPKASKLSGSFSGDEMSFFDMPVIREMEIDGLFYPFTTVRMEEDEMGATFSSDFGRCKPLGQQ